MGSLVARTISMYMLALLVSAQYIQAKFVVEHGSLKVSFITELGDYNSFSTKIASSQYTHDNIQSNLRFHIGDSFEFPFQATSMYLPQVTNPDDLKGNYDIALANFGVPMYGAELRCVARDELSSIFEFHFDSVNHITGRRIDVLLSMPFGEPGFSQRSVC